ncbi:MAG: 16S rRNA (cytosine(967)-C(5))-methyltransferase RsmB, partial [Desulfobulbaceae bacterium]|nr:16S rRNA (cytosine(967)-C(5))-methyltransferase RsmB [Desulfobulbaceae bacterium]
MKNNPRGTAIGILSEWQRKRTPVEQLCEQGLTDFVGNDPRDRQLAWSLVLGVVRQLRFLDWVIGRYSKHPPAKMKPLTLQALRVGVYQLLFLDRVPASAAINETVQALKVAKQPKWLTGFVNGLLRNVDRNRGGLGGEGLAFGVRYSHPDWLVKRWQARYGAGRAEAICRSNNALPSLTLRLDLAAAGIAEYIETLRTAGIEAKAGRYAPTAVSLPGYRGAVRELPGYGQGWFQVQDEAAQLVSLLLAPFGEGAYLDGCAGLGGKTTHLARLLPAAARLVAVEPSEPRRLLLRENLARLQLAGRVEIVAGELDDLEESAARFDGILIDAPCSGLGVVRRHPDIRWHREEAELVRYQAKQLDLLASSARLLQPGGVLVYATCSMEPEEGEE